MRVIAAVPAAGLLAGAAAGLFIPDVPRLPLYAFLIGGGALAWRAWHVADTRLLTIAVVSAFFAGAALLSAEGWQRAWRPSLWTTFEALAREQRQEAEAAGRRLPLDDEAFAVVRGRLRADAALTARRSAKLEIQTAAPAVSNRQFTSGMATSGRASFGA